MLIEEKMMKMLVFCQIWKTMTETDPTKRQAKNNLKRDFRLRAKLTKLMLLKSKHSMNAVKGSLEMSFCYHLDLESGAQACNADSYWNSNQETRMSPK